MIGAEVRPCEFPLLARGDVLPEKAALPGFAAAGGVSRLSGAAPRTHGDEAPEMALRLLCVVQRRHCGVAVIKVGLPVAPGEYLVAAWDS